MVTLIQDYKNWRHASKNYRKAKADLDACYDSIIYDVSYPEFMWNLELMKAFVKSLPKDNGQPDYKNDLKLAYSIGGKIFRAGSCFFKLNQVMFIGNVARLKQERECKTKIDFTFSEYKRKNKMTERKKLKQRYDAAKAAVTTVRPVIDLTKPVSIISCINVFKRVVGAGFNEQTDFTLDCEHLKSGEFCSHTRCDHYAEHMEYIMAADAYKKVR